MSATWARWSAAGLFGLAACSGPTGQAPMDVHPSAPAVTPASPQHAAEWPRAADDALPALRAQIERLIGSAPCRDVSQCRALPMGSKPCGGPESYLAWSVVNTDAARLEALAQRHAEASRERNRRSELMSNCAIVPEPLLLCVVTDGSEGRCQTAPDRSGQPSLVVR